MYLELAAGAFMLGEWIYHSFIEKKPVPTAEPAKVPITEEGRPVPLIFGRVRVRQPVLAWHNTPTGTVAGAGPINGKLAYNAALFFNLGIGMRDGLGTNRLYRIWAADMELKQDLSDPGFSPPYGPISALDGDGGPEDFARHAATVAGTDSTGTIYASGAVEFLNGKPTQEMQIGGISETRAAALMHDLGGIDLGQIPGYRGYLSVLLYDTTRHSAWNTATTFVFGLSPQLAAYSFECSSYADGGGYPAVGIYAVAGGQDSNPVNVIYDVLTGYWGKLGLATSMIDMPSFQAAATRCYSEGNGYSRVFEDFTDAVDIIEEVLTQINGILFLDPTTNTIKLKLIRNDYNPQLVPVINRNNCQKLTNLAVGGHTNIVNKVRVIYTDRSRDYQDNSETAQNPSNAFAADSQIVEAVLKYPGVTYAELAAEIAARDLAARSRPIIKCKAIVDRSFYRTLPGDVVRLVYTSPDINLFFRVANVERGTLEDGAIALDLVLDNFYVWRDQAPKNPHFGSGTFGGDLGTVSDEIPPIHIGK